MDNLKHWLSALIFAALIYLSVTEARYFFSLVEKGPEIAPDTHTTALEDALNVVETGIILSEKISMKEEYTAASPFGETPSPPRRRRRREPSFERTPLKLQGNMQGRRPMAVVRDPSGKTHIVTVEDTLFSRRIVSIHDGCIILRDPAGTDTLFVDHE
jgi:hypothetical protein